MNFLRSHQRLKFEFPEGKEFAFTILDDTDDSTVDNVKPMYDLLGELGLRTTKTVWPLDCPEGSRQYFAGQTLNYKPYREFVHDLPARGFELTWHCATMESSDRARTTRGLDVFHREFGFYPKVHCNHGQNRENIYWGPKRYQNSLIRALASLLGPHGSATFCGELETSPYFWGDLCRTHFRFVRNFSFRRLNMLKVNPHMPYRLEATPYVNFWFSTADAPDVDAFNRLLTREGVDRLRRENGVGIVTTHLGKGFVKDGQINRQTAEMLRYIAALPGWFVPVSDILEFLLVAIPHHTLGHLARLRLEFLHATDRAWGRVL